ncbi:hypothetical protein ACWC10_08620 [Streptomyces sp. NPDC001595]|uniref:hypothetical protein n=1 Tax=Streptomyces sp. NPDC001532 TaxID=3154520 RepID=UPI00331C77E7
MGSQPAKPGLATLLRAETDEGTYLLVVESQGKVDDRKRGSWPYYLSYLYEKYRCEPVLIVITQNSATAKWASRPIRFGFPGWNSLTVRPLVLGPDNVPVITDERQAERDVPLAVLSAMTHGRGRQAPAILEALASALRSIDSDSAAVFVQFVDSCLTDPQAKQMWRDLMTAIQYFWRHPLAEQVREEGRIESCRQMVLQILEWRGIPVPNDIRHRVDTCTDLRQLETWAQRAVHAADAAELFAAE